MSNAELVQSLKWKMFPVLTDGSVCLVDAMGNETDICDAARVSYGKGTRSVSDDTNLIRYLMRHRHGTPFEMAEIKIAVRAPLYVVRQWHRHRTWSYNEYSGRYSEMIDSMDTAGAGGWRIQSTTNKQGSEGAVSEWPEGYKPRYDHEQGLFILDCPDGSQWHRFAARLEDITPQDYLSEIQDESQARVSDEYKERLLFGVAREQARMDLPVSNYTEMYAKTDLRNMLGFLALRMDPHAQIEIRQYANIIGEQIVKPLFPNVYQAFIDYMLESVSMSRIDQAVCVLMTRYGRCGSDRQFAEDVIVSHAGACGIPVEFKNKRSRERDECIDKLVLLGVVSE